jgi:hypothetical protein
LSAAPADDGAIARVASIQAADNQHVMDSRMSSRDQNVGVEVNWSCGCTRPGVKFSFHWLKRERDVG